MPREDAERRARELVDEILREARAHDHKALLRIDADADTQMLLDMLPDKATNTAQVHLRGARIWREQQRKKVKDRFVEVQRALDGFDPGLAKGLLQRVDTDLLGDQERRTYDNLLLNTEARLMEMERFNETTSAITAEHDEAHRKKRWWRRES